MRVPSPRFTLPGGLSMIGVALNYQGLLWPWAFGAVLAVSCCWALLSIATHKPIIARLPALSEFWDVVAPILEPAGFRFAGTLAKRLRELEVEGQQIRDTIERRITAAAKRKETIEEWTDEVTKLLKSQAPHLYLIFESPNDLPAIRCRSRHEARKDRINLENTIALNSGTQLFSPEQILGEDEIADLINLERRLDGLNEAIRQFQKITILSKEAIYV